MTRDTSSERFADARVLLVGAGGLGCPAALALAHAGVGTLAILDDDDVERSNLHRQILYGESSVGDAKVDQAARTLARLAPAVRVERLRGRLVPEDALERVRGFDVVIEGSDNFATKFLAADACAVAGVPIVHGAAVRWVGTALAVGARVRPCYRCLFEDVPEAAQAGCNEAGVMGPVVGVVGAFLADLALRMLAGEDVGGTLVTFDGRADVLRERRVAPRKSCALCNDPSAFAGFDAARYVAPVRCEAS
jgi:molybdopterin/thiamine biosynthesis adenylyltransferase